MPSGDAKHFDASTRVTHACTEAAALPTSQNEALHADDVLRAAGEEILYQEAESSAKMTGSRMAFASRG